MFCASLRKREEWAPVPSTLLSQQRPKWKGTMVNAVVRSHGSHSPEQELETHDLAIPLPQRQKEPKDVFRLLLLSSVDIQPPEKSLARIERLYQAGGKNVGIIFLLHEKESKHGGTGAFMRLQAMYDMIQAPQLQTLTKTPVSSHLVSRCPSYHYPQLPLSAILYPYSIGNFSSLTLICRYSIQQLRFYLTVPTILRFLSMRGTY